MIIQILDETVVVLQGFRKQWCQFFLAYDMVWQENLARSPDCKADVLTTMLSPWFFMKIHTVLH